MMLWVTVDSKCPAAPKRILVIKQRRLGDTILWTSALEALTQWAPNAEIDIAFPKAYKTLFEKDPRFKNQIHLHTSFRSNLNYVPWMRQRQYDLALSFHSSKHGRLLATLSGAKHRITHHHDRNARLYGSQTRVVNLGQPMSALERDLNVVRTLGWDNPSPLTKIHASQTWVDKALGRLQSLGKIDSKPLVLIGIGASRLAKQWPLEKYLKTCELLRAQSIQIGVVYEPSHEATHSDYFMEKLKRISFLLPTPTLDQLMGYLKCADLYLGNDSGAKHLAAALGVHTLTLFGPESVGEWHSYSLTDHPVFHRQVNCRNNNPEPPQYAWCGHSACPLASHACLNLIQPQEVANKVLEMMTPRHLSSTVLQPSRSSSTSLHDASI